MIIDIPKEISGKRVSLLKMLPDHVDGLFAASQDPNIWKLLPHNGFLTVNEAATWVSEALAMTDQVPFMIVNASGDVIGSTRYICIEPYNKALEIGWTWLNPSYWGSHHNTECKFLLLQYAFEELKYNRVQFRTDIRNIRSQKAIERLGAVKEGVFRSDRLLPDGFRRDSVYYSILIEEWHDSVKFKLTNILRDVHASVALSQSLS